MFADDSVLISSHADPIAALSNLERDLEKISSYFCIKSRENKNPKHRRESQKSRPHCFPDVRNNGVVIEAVKSFCYIGVHIDHCLKLNLHLNNCIRRAHGKIYLCSVNLGLTWIKWQL